MFAYWLRSLNDRNFHFSQWAAVDFQEPARCGCCMLRHVSDACTSSRRLGVPERVQCQHRCQGAVAAVHRLSSAAYVTGLMAPYMLTVRRGAAPVTVLVTRCAGRKAMLGSTVRRHLQGRHGRTALAKGACTRAYPSALPGIDPVVSICVRRPWTELYGVACAGKAQPGNASSPAAVSVQLLQTSGQTDVPLHQRKLLECLYAREHSTASC